MIEEKIRAAPNKVASRRRDDRATWAGKQADAKAKANRHPVDQVTPASKQAAVKAATTAKKADATRAGQKRSNPA